MCLRAVESAVAKRVVIDVLSSMCACLFVERRVLNLLRVSFVVV